MRLTSSLIRPITRTPRCYQGTNRPRHNVDDTPDTHKPISTATQVALDAKANDPFTVKPVSDQTIAGVKTFSSPHLVPAAGGPNQAINKSQMDTADNPKVNKYGT